MKVLAISVHPDDETLGCGGSLLKHAARGDSLHWLLVTAVDQPVFSSAQVAKQREQVKAVEKAYPFETLDWLKFPTTRLESVPFNELIDAIRVVIERVRPNFVYIPNRSDVHSDHRIVCQAAQAVLKPIYMRSLGVSRVLACEVLSETDASPPFAENAFLPNVFVDVSDTLERKLEIMQIYETELHPGFLPRSPSALRAMARFRGATIGVEYAESFMLVRELT